MSDDGFPAFTPMSPQQEAGLSEGFCAPCRVRLDEPSLGVDGDTHMYAARCPNCRTVYFWAAPEGTEQ